MKAPHSPDPLSRVLKDWRVAPPRTPQFRAEVWSRIGTRPEGVSWGAYARRHFGAVAGALALAVAVGALGGRDRAQARAAAESAQLAAAYVQGLDARAMVMK